MGDSYSLGKSSLWYPPAPEDPDKPTLPYLPGFSVQIRRHAPPPAFATVQELEGLGHQERPSLSQEYLHTVTHSEAVVANPPVEGIPGSAQAGTAQLIITYFAYRYWGCSRCPNRRLHSHSTGRKPVCSSCKDLRPTIPQLPD